MTVNAIAAICVVGRTTAGGRYAVANSISKQQQQQYSSTQSSSSTL